MSYMRARQRKGERFLPARLYRKDRITIVVCPYCREMVPSAFSGQPFWKGWEIIVRTFHICGNCGSKMLVFRGIREEVLNVEITV